MCRANDICRESKRQTINADDVLKAVEELDFPEFSEPLMRCLAGRFAPSNPFVNFTHMYDFKIIDAELASIFNRLCCIWINRVVMEAFQCCTLLAKNVDCISMIFSGIPSSVKFCCGEFHVLKLFPCCSFSKGARREETR